MLKEKNVAGLKRKTVQQKIVSESNLPYSNYRKSGPTVELFYHELTHEPRFSQKVIAFVTKLALTYSFLATLLACSIIVKLNSRGPLFKKREVLGKRGIPFGQYIYNIDDMKPGSFWARMLYKTGFYRLPSVINIWKGEMSVVGPAPYPKSYCNRWSKELSDYYKRFAVRPGFFSVSQPIADTGDFGQVRKALRQEFNYLLRPTPKKDLKHIFG